MAVETVVLKAQLRDGKGSKKAAGVRAAGLIPAVVYGHKQSPVSIAIPVKDFAATLAHGSRLFSVEVNSKSEAMLLKDVQYDYLGKDILHVDFMRVDLSEKIKVEVPLEVKGVAKGQADGGIIDVQHTTIEVECVVTSIPESISINVKNLNVGDVIHAKDIKLPDGVTLISDPDALILSCHVLAEEVVAEGEEAAATPEVIGRKEKEEGEAEGAK